MEPKKSPQVDLENKRSVFFLTGLFLALVVVYISIEWKTYDRTLANLGDLDLVIDEEEVIVTQREQKPPPPPPPQDIINVVEDKVELKEELVMESTETSQTEEIRPIEVVEEEVDEIFSFAIVENKPLFPGCEKEKDEEARSQCFQLKIQQHIVRNFKYPEIARQLGIQGKVFITFIIDKDGSVTNVSVARGVDPNLDQAAVDAVKSLNNLNPKIQPAKQRGKPVRMSFTVPVNARLQ
ncbi:MAG: energy transducer TonB [Thermaurantimonas sp.]